MNQKRTRSVWGLLAVLAAPLTLPGASIGRSEPHAWRFAHAEAQILAGVDFRKLAESADGRQIREQFAAALGNPLMAHTERLLLSTVAEASGRRSDILILSGSFSLPQLRKMASEEGATMLSYKGLEIAARPSARAGDPHLAWMTGAGGGTTVLIGTRPAVQAAAERSKANVESLAAVNALFARAGDLALEYPVWMTSETIPQGFGPRSLDPFADGGGEEGSGQVNGFDMGMQAAAPALNLWVWTTSETTAQTVLQKLTAAAATPESFLLAPWLPQMKGAIDDNTLVLGRALPVGTLAVQAGPLLTALGFPVEIRAVSRPVKKAEAAAPLPVPFKPMVIRIQGLEDGMRTIPYPKER